MATKKSTPRSTARREIARQLLLDPETACLSDGELKKRTGISHRIFGAERRKLEAGLPVEFVYFMRAGKTGPIKIGTSCHPEERRKGLQGMSPWPIFLLGWIPGGAEVERATHLRFAHLHLHHEWFKPARELLDFVKSEAKQTSTGDDELAASEKRVRVYRTKHGTMATMRLGRIGAANREKAAAMCAKMRA